MHSTLVVDSLLNSIVLLESTAELSWLDIWTALTTQLPSIGSPLMSSTDR
jgi:hypothetical protein